MKKMKNLVTIFFVFGIFCIANAQEIQSKKGENYLPEAADWAISFNANGVFKYLGNAFNGKLDNEAPSFSSPNGNAFVGKKFITDKSAYRVVAELGYISNSELINFANNEASFIKQTGLGVTLGFGKEWRRGKTRLQGFYGADVLVTMNSGSFGGSKTNAITGAFIESSELKKSLGFGAGVQGFLGAEYFIFPKFSLGAQYTYRVGFSNEGELTITKKIGNAAPVTANFGKTSNYNLGSLGVPFINLTLHF